MTKFHLFFMALFMFACGGNSFVGAEGIAFDDAGAGTAGFDAGNAGTGGQASSGGSGGSDTDAGAGTGSTAGLAGQGGAGAAGSAGMAGAGQSGSGGNQGGSGGSTAGASGAGSAGMAGISGSSSGSAGISGTSGNSGSAGVGSVGGSAGSSGSSGSGGSQAGSAGTSGSSGSAGNAGSSGSGQAGSGGTAGVSGSAGTGGTTMVCTPNTACPDDGNPCTDDLCNSQGSACLHPAKNNGVSCGSSSSSVCDKPDSCQNGACVPNFVAANTACTDDGNPCTKDACDGQGACQHPAGNVGTVCQAASCSNGTVSQQSTCTGASSVCPVQVQTSCNGGGCDASGKACEFPNIAKVDTKIDTAPAVLAMDNDASFIYAAVKLPSGSQILRYAKSDSTKTVLFQETDTTKWAYAMIVVNGHIYFSESAGQAGNISMINTTGTMQTAQQVASYPTFGFAKNSSRVYWSDMTQTACACPTLKSYHVYSVAIGGTSPTTFAMGFNEMSPDIEVDEANLYVWGLQNYSGTVYSPSLASYSLTDPVNSNQGLNNGYITVGANTYYLSSLSGAMPGLTKNSSTVFANSGISGNGPMPGVPSSINAILKIQNNVETVLNYTSPVGLTTTFAADANKLYLSMGDGLWQMPVGGGSPTILAPHSLYANSLTVDGSQAYFGSAGYWTTPGPYSGKVPDVQIYGIYKVSTN